MPFLIPLVILLAIAIVLVLGLAARPENTRQPGGKIFAFVAIFLLPALGLWMGFETHVEQAKQRTFCLSCHVMKPYGKSLYGPPQVTQYALNAAQPGALGAFVAWMLSPECTWTVGDGERRRKIIASDVCLLFRRFLHFGNDITREEVLQHGGA